MADYLTIEELKAQAEADEASPDAVYTALVTAVSRMFDRECEVPDGFFGVAPIAGSETVKTLRADGTKYLSVGPYITDSITALSVDGTSRFADGTYHEQDGYIIWDSGEPDVNAIVIVIARFGFAAVPADIVQACIEQALFIWRKKDLAFTNESGVSASVVTAEFSPTFKSVTKRYREIYSERNYFA